MTDLTQYIRAELFVLVPVLYLLGAIFKKSPVKDWLIPYLLCAAGVLLSAAYFAGEGTAFLELVFSSVTQGVLCASCSVFANNLIKQFCARGKDGEEADETKTVLPDQQHSSDIL